MFGGNTDKPNGPVNPPAAPGVMPPPPSHLDPVGPLTAPVNSPGPGSVSEPSAPSLERAATSYLETSPAYAGSPAEPSNSFSANTPAVPAPPSSTMPPANLIQPAAPDNLIRLKQQALDNLAPLVDKLEQPPDERFKTLMMMIQASDDPTYLNEAYSAASQIKDEKERAQALLDIVNEINYFSQQPNKES